MKNCAVVCEYNPFHSGHKYQIDCVRKFGIDNLICVMSGEFVQSGLPAFCDKTIRTKAALSAGADAVIQLPTVFSTASAQYFATGAIKIISGIKDITYLAMGATCAPEPIIELSECKTRHLDEFNDILHKEFDGGKSYNAASTAAIIKVYSEYCGNESVVKDIFNEPNNILCIEYITALHKYAPHIKPLILRRYGAKHNDKAIISAPHISATAIRTALKNGDKSVLQFLPYYAQEIANSPAVNIDAYKKIAAFTVNRLDTLQIAAFRNCSEGLEYKLKSCGNRFDDIVTGSTSRRYNTKRINRLLLDCILNITKDLLDYDFCTRLLGAKSGFEYSILPQNVLLRNADLKSAKEKSEQVKRVLIVDETAALLYNILTETNGGYYNFSVVKA